MKISIITPSYNQSRFLEKNLKSVANQEYSNVEHIVIDGGSTDDTVDLLERYEQKYDLKWVSEPDRGQSHAVNKGINKATGDWIGWQNSDDFYLPRAFRRLISKAKANPNSDVICGDLVIVDENGQKIDQSYSIYPSEYIQRHWSLFTSNQCTFFHSRVFKKLGLLNEDCNYTMDAELFQRITEAGLSIELIPEFMGAFRKHSDQKTHNDSIPRQIEELDNIYTSNKIDRVVPEQIHKCVALSLKGAYLINQGRWDAIRWNFIKRIYPDY